MAGCFAKPFIYSFIKALGMQRISLLIHEYSSEYKAVGYQLWCHSLAFILNVVKPLNPKIKFRLHGCFKPT